VFGAGLGITEDSSGGFSLNVLANDPGSATLYGLYTFAPSTPSLGANTAAKSASGADLAISNGVVVYTATAESKAKFQYLAEGETATYNFAYVIKMGNGALSTAVATVTIVGANDKATISGALATNISEDDGPASGVAFVSDADHDQSVFASATSPTKGTYGDFSFNQGAWTFSLNGDAQSLAEGETKTETLTVNSLDGTDTKSIVVTIKGVNDKASITGDSEATVGEDGGAAAGTLTVHDVDHDQNVFAPGTSSNSDYGAFTFDAGSWTFSVNDHAQTLGAGVIATQKLTVSSKDGTASQDITVTIVGANDAAKISGGAAGELIEDGGVNSVAGQLSISDIDSGEAIFASVDQSALVGKYGTFAFDSATGQWSYMQGTSDAQAAAVQALNSGYSGTDALTVTSWDGTASQTISVSIKGVDEPKIDNQGTKTATEKIVDTPAPDHAAAFKSEPTTVTLKMSDFNNTSTVKVDGFTAGSILDVPTSFRYTGSVLTDLGVDLNFVSKHNEFDVILVERVCCPALQPLTTTARTMRTVRILVVRSPSFPTIARRPCCQCASRCLTWMPGSVTKAGNRRQVSATPSWPPMRKT